MVTSTGAMGVSATGNLLVSQLVVSSDGPASADARTHASARAAGIDTIMDRCIYKEWLRLMNA